MACYSCHGFWWYNGGYWGFKRISFLISSAKSIVGLFSSTILSCLTVNITASDQYLSIVIPGKMFSKAFEDRNLSPVNLSRTIEDSGTVTSVLIHGIPVVLTSLQF